MAGWPDLPAAIGALRRHAIPLALALTDRLLQAFPDEYEAHVMRITALFDAWGVDNSAAPTADLWAALAGLGRVDSGSPMMNLVAPISCGSRQGRWPQWTVYRQDWPACRKL